MPIRTISSPDPSLFDRHIPIIWCAARQRKHTVWQFQIHRLTPPFLTGICCLVCWPAYIIWCGPCCTTLAQIESGIMYWRGHWYMPFVAATSGDRQQNEKGAVSNFSDRVLRNDMCNGAHNTAIRIAPNAAVVLHDLGVGKVEFVDDQATWDILGWRMPCADDMISKQNHMAYAYVIVSESLSLRLDCKFKHASVYIVRQHNLPLSTVRHAYAMRFCQDIMNVYGVCHPRMSHVAIRELRQSWLPCMITRTRRMPLRTRQIYPIANKNLKL